MKAPFDKIAENYDETFTFSPIGKAQRQLVRHYLQRHVQNSRKLNILELNCGTGEDALWLAKLGHRVFATDISQKMIEIARKKKSQNDKLDIKFGILDLKEIENYGFKEKFDLVFSNFGGLNCLDQKQLISLGTKLNKITASEGKFISVIMSNNCLFESLYYTLRGKWNEVFRRKKNHSVLLSKGVYQSTYYYTPQKYFSFYSTQFHKRSLKPIGLFLPPSYLNKFFFKNKTVLKILLYLDQKIFTNQFFAGFADHFYLELAKNEYA